MSENTTREEKKYESKRVGEVFTKINKKKERKTFEKNSLWMKIRLEKRRNMKERGWGKSVIRKKEWTFVNIREQLTLNESIRREEKLPGENRPPPIPISASVYKVSAANSFTTSSYPTSSL